MAAVVSLRDVSKVYLIRDRIRLVAVERASLDVERGEFVVVTGPQGSGKSTLLGLASGLLAPSAGTVSVAGLDVWRLAEAERLRWLSRHAGRVPQLPWLLTSLTALENVMVAGGAVLPAGGPPARRRAESLLAEVGLAARAHAYPRQLSAEEQRRVAVARALNGAPEVLFVDGPAPGQDGLMELLWSLRRRHDVAVVAATYAAWAADGAVRTIEVVDGLVREGAGAVGSAAGWRAAGLGRAQPCACLPSDRWAATAACTPA